MYNYLFVYGTLMKGYNNYGLISNYVYGIMPAKTEGELYNLGSFPAANIHYNSEIKKWIHGQLFKFKKEDMNKVLSFTDGLEGYNMFNPEESFYLRESVFVKPYDSQEKIKAWMYTIPNVKQYSNMLIKNGKWGDNQDTEINPFFSTISY